MPKCSPKNSKFFYISEFSYIPKQFLVPEGLICPCTKCMEKRAFLSKEHFDAFIKTVMGKVYPTGAHK